MCAYVLVCLQVLSSSLFFFFFLNGKSNFGLLQRQKKRLINLKQKFLVRKLLKT